MAAVAVKVEADAAANAPPAAPTDPLTACVALWPARSSRLPRMLERITAEPYDTEAWTVVLQEAQQQLKPEHFRPIFDRFVKLFPSCLLYTSPSPRDRTRSRMPSSA